MMPFDTAVRVSVLLLVALAVLPLLQRQPAGLRHCLLVAALACAALMPALERAVPGWRIGASPPALEAPASQLVPVAPAPSVQPDGQAPSHVPVPITTWLAAIWMAGTAAGLVLVAAGLGRLAYLTRASRPLDDARWVRVASDVAVAYGLRRVPRLRQGVSPAMLATWGMVRPVILVPPGARDWPENRVHAVLAHELAHVRRGDWATQLTVRLLACVYWFSPPVWLAWRCLRHESERACDEAVLRLGVPAADYASHLLNIARATLRRPSLPHLALPMARSSTLERRIRAMLHHHTPMKPAGRKSMTLAALLAAVAALPIAGYGSTETMPVARPAVDRAVASPLGERQVEADDSTAGPAAVGAPASRPPLGQVPSLAESPVAAQTAPGAGIAQEGSALFAGSIRDPSGTPIRDARLDLIARGSGDARQTVTDATGTFRYEQLPSGVYELRASAPGFAQTRIALTLSDGQVMERVIGLTLGTQVESIVIRLGTGAVPASGEPGERLEPPAAVPCTDASVSCITPARAIGRVRPVHPGVSGVVILEGVIGVDGTITHARVLRTPHSALSQATLEAVKQWVYEPVMLNGVATMTIVTITASFE